MVGRIRVKYRPPVQNVDSYLEHLDKLISTICNENKNILLMGDFNIDCCPTKTSSEKNKLLQIITTNGLVQLINAPTRITANGQSTIDNFFINKSNKVKLVGTFLSDISDHLPIIASIDTSKTKEMFSSDVGLENKFSFSSMRIDKLNDELKAEGWQDVLSCRDVNKAFNMFVDIYKKCFNKNCLITNRKKNLKLLKQKPWIDKNIKWLKKQTFQKVHQES